MEWTTFDLNTFYFQKKNEKHEKFLRKLYNLQTNDLVIAVFFLRSETIPISYVLICRLVI